MPAALARTSRAIAEIAAASWWFEDRRPKCLLLVYIDDATIELVHLKMVGSESTFTYMEATREYIKRHGKPVAFYSDKHSVFRNAKASATGAALQQGDVHPGSEGYAGEKLRDAIACHGDWTIEIIKRPDAAKGFEVLPRRWVVERTFAWLGRCRRLAKAWGTSVSSSTAWALVAAIHMLTQRTARYCYA